MTEIFVMNNVLLNTTLNKLTDIIQCVVQSSTSLFNIVLSKILFITNISVIIAIVFQLKLLESFFKYNPCLNNILINLTISQHFPIMGVG